MNLNTKVEKSNENVTYAARNCLFTDKKGKQHTVKYSVITNKADGKKGIILAGVEIIPMEYDSIVMLAINETYPERLFFKASKNQTTEPERLWYNTLTKKIEHFPYQEFQSYSGGIGVSLLLGVNDNKTKDVIDKKTMMVLSKNLEYLQYMKDSDYFVGYRSYLDDSKSYALFDGNGDLMFDDRVVYRDFYTEYDLDINGKRIPIFLFRISNGLIFPFIPGLIPEQANKINGFKEFVVLSNGFIEAQMLNGAYGVLKIEITDDSKVRINIVKPFTILTVKERRKLLKFVFNN